MLSLLIAIAGQVVAQNAQSQPAGSENLRNNLVYDEAHLTVLRASSNKEVVQQRIAEEYEVVALLGDNSICLGPSIEIFQCNVCFDKSESLH